MSLVKSKIFFGNIETVEDLTRYLTIWARQLEVSLNSGITVPTGGYMYFDMETAPVGWLACDGSEVNRTTYANLFAVIGTRHGEGNGTTTFNLPNVERRVWLVRVERKRRLWAMRLGILAEVKR